jgi:hypothetical protein
MPWGEAWWFYEMGPDGYPLRKVEVYGNGNRLRYGPGHDRDHYGRLHDGEEPYEHEDGSAMTEIDAAAFERDWETGPWLNA